MDEQAVRLVVETSVERREDGLMMTFRYADDGIEQWYMSPAEAQDILDQIKRQLSDSASENEEKLT